MNRTTKAFPHNLDYEPSNLNKEVVALAAKIQENSEGRGI
jgi:hypothetical protein